MSRWSTGFIIMRRFRGRVEPQDRSRNVPVHVPGHRLHKDDASETQASPSGGIIMINASLLACISRLHIAFLFSFFFFTSRKNVFRAFCTPSKRYNCFQLALHIIRPQALFRYLYTRCAVFCLFYINTILFIFHFCRRPSWFYISSQGRTIWRGYVALIFFTFLSLIFITSLACVCVYV